MKQCPACGTTYTDDTLSFCLADGSPLNTTGEQPTVLKSPVRVDVASPEPRTVVIPGDAAERRKYSPVWIKAVFAVVILGILGIAALGLLGGIFYFGTGNNERTITVQSPTPDIKPTSTPDKEKERLSDELANVQKKIDDQKKSGVNTSPFPANDKRASRVKAKVDSPNDGFLALRNIPDADRGIRIAKVPHGSEVELNNCEKTQVTISGRTGRWCQVEYGGQTGWVFDAWLDY
jgi:SH3 domain-containing protein